MARYSTSTVNQNSTFTVYSLADIQNLRNLHMRYYLKVNGANNDDEIIAILNLIPTVISQFKGLFKLAEIPAALGGYAVEASATQKSNFLTQLNNGYYFYNDYLLDSWDTNLRSVKYLVPSATLIDSSTGKKLTYIASRSGRVVSKTTTDGITITY